MARMPQALKDLSKDLERALAKGDAELVASIRRTIAEAHPETDEGAEAAYKLGLESLFRSKDIEEASEWLRKAAKAKSKEWGPLARTSLGLLLHRQGKLQQAVFELRKAAGGVPSIAGAVALGLTVILFREAKNGAEADRARADQKKMLLALTKGEDAEDAALAHYMLGMEHKHDGERADAKRHLEAAVKSNALAGDAAEKAKAALKDI